MKIWYVSIKNELYGSDISCAWNEKKDALSYFRKEAISCHWKTELLTGEDSLLDNYKYVEYFCSFENEHFIAGITPLFLNELPYIEKSC